MQRTSAIKPETGRSVERGKTYPGIGHIAEQVSRFMTLANQPPAELVKATVAEFERVYLQYADSDIHATAITDLVLERNEFFPQPKHIVDAASEVREKLTNAAAARRWKSAESSCYVCGGTGYIHVDRGGYSYAGACDCRKVRV